MPDNGLETAVAMLSAQFAQHVQDCMQQRRDADRQRQDFRQEVSEGLDRLSGKMDKALGLAVVTGLSVVGYLVVFWVQHS